MKLKELFRGANTDARPLDKNPYLNARRVMNEQTGMVLRSRQIWQAVALLSLLITFGSVGGVIYMGTRSTFVPYVVEVNELGRAVAVKPADKAGPVDERVVHSTLASFVADLRSVSFDRKVQNEAIWRVFSHLQTGTAATTKTTDFMEDAVTNPLKKAEELSVGVEIASVLQQTAETWEVNWVETVWDRKGVRLEQYHMRGLLTIYVNPPTRSTTEDELRRNPLGIFVRDFTWSKVKE